MNGLVRFVVTQVVWNLAIVSVLFPTSRGNAACASRKETFQRGERHCWWKMQGELIYSYDQWSILPFPPVRQDVQERFAPKGHHVRHTVVRAYLRKVAGTGRQTQTSCADMHVTANRKTRTAGPQANHIAIASWSVRKSGGECAAGFPWPEKTTGRPRQPCHRPPDSIRYAVAHPVLDRHCWRVVSQITAWIAPCEACSCQATVAQSTPSQQRELLWRTTLGAARLGPATCSDASTME